MHTILFVEDDHPLRAVFGEFLRNEGFTVLEASDMAEAVQACSEYSGGVDLTIADIRTGRQLATSLTTKYPGMRVLFIGDREEAVSRPRPPEFRHRFLRKPFSADDLLRVVHSLIQPEIVV